jgi:uncharacterized protein
MGIVRGANADQHPELVKALLDPRAYPEAQHVEHLETHISHVFLTGRYAYKIKKPVDLGFLDFSTLAKRRHYCEEELRINRRVAPELYLAVVPVTGAAATPHVEGHGTPLEYAVKMRQFAQDGLLEHVLERGELTPALIDALATEVARFHTSIPGAPPEAACGSTASIVAPAAQNFEQLAPLLEQDEDREALDRLREWTHRQGEALAPQFAARRSAGFVRECHGDLHLANMVLIDEKVRLFDAIEFDPALRWIDVMSDVAFTVMDLAARGRDDLGARFLDAYLGHTGDYPGARVLRYYVVYRAVVRAKIAAMRGAQASVDGAQREHLVRKCRDHLRLARRVALSARPALIIHHGLSGSGKTWASQAILESIGAIRIRSDVERKRLHGLEASARTAAAVGSGIYSQEASQLTYGHLAQLAEDGLAGGFPVLVDATFLKRAQRQAFRALAERMRVPFRIASFVASCETMRARIASRAAAAADASEAGPQVLEAQLREHEPLGADEEKLSVRIDTERLPPHELAVLAHDLVAAQA